MRILKILNVNKFYHIRGGADRYYFDLTKILEQFGHQVIPFATKHIKNLPSQYERFFIDGFTEEDFYKLDLFQKTKAFFNGIYSFAARRKLGELIEYVKPDIAHLHGLFYQISLSVIDELYDRRIPIIYSLHDYQTVCANAFLYYNGKECRRCQQGRYLNIILRRCYRNNFSASLMAYFAKKLHQWKKTLEKVTLFTVPHKCMRDIFVDWGFDENKFRIILNPFIYDNIIPYPSDEDLDYFVFYGRLSKNKGIFTVLEAFKRLRNKKLKIFGNGPDVDFVNRFIIENNLDNISLDTKLRWGGKLKEAIGKSVAVISCSEWPTPSEYINYESMALGKPIIASDALGNLDMIQEGENGYIYKKGNVDGLIAKIKLLLQKDTHDMGRKSRLFLEKKINIDKFYKELIAIYEEAIDLGKRGK